MKIALAQINPTIADLAGNVELCLNAIDTAAAHAADLVVLPEMALPGFPPRDILCDSSFTDAVSAATQDLAQQAKGGPPTIVGTIGPSGQHPPHHPGLYNLAVLLRAGESHTIAIKRLLPTYDVFHETRWFLPGPPLPPVTIAGQRVGVLICEDLWDEGYASHPPQDLLDAGADLLIGISASPYRRGALQQRLYHARRPRCPLVYVNMVGANDELIFDGSSFALNANGDVLMQLPAFEQAVQVVDIQETRSKRQEVGSKRQEAGSKRQEAGSKRQEAGSKRQEMEKIDADEEVFRALVLGIRDFAHKNGLRQATLGLSGGVDSAVAAVIAAEALGPKNVTGIAIHSRFNDPRSTTTAQTLAATLGIGFELIELEPLHRAAENTLSELLTRGTAAENVQARLRALILMAFVNRYGGMLLNTSNKTELTVGYSTLYGDMAGTLCPIADLTKPEIYALAQWMQRTRGKPIPAFTIARPPSAELKADQVDPFNYPKIAPRLEDFVRHNRSNSAIRRAEHKRWHMGVILKVSDKAFGTGRMIPITRR